MAVLRSLLLSCLLALALSQTLVAANVAGEIRAPQATTTPAGSTATSSTTTTASATTSNASTTTKSDSATVTTTSATSTSTSVPPTTTTTASASTTTTPSTTTASSTVSQTTQEITTTDSQGEPATITITHTSSSTSSSSSSTPSASSTPSGGGGLGTGSIIGLSVAGGVALIGIIAFFVWKLTRKRFNDFDDNEAIKWPELNTHSGPSDSHPLPVHSTGRAGFDTGSEVSLSRVNSSNYSTPDFASGSQDPYAVPPLPHLNPNQPYRDDPTGANGYYDPYHGPVPGTLEQGAAGGGEWTGEAIPMTQMSAGRMSPGPNAAMRSMTPPAGTAAYGTSYEPEHGYESGRQSPEVHAVYAGRTSPGPQAVYGGRSSPGAHVAYDSYGTGRQ